METIKNTESLDRLILRIIYHDAQLGADARFPEMLQAIGVMYDRARALESQRQNETAARIRKLAMRVRAEIRLDEIVRDFELALLGLVRRDKQDERYLLFFGKLSMARIITESIPEKIDHVRRLIESLDNPSVAALRDPHKAALQTTLDLLATAQNQYDEAIQALEITSYSILAFKEELTILFRSHYGELIKAIPRKKQEVEQFFLRFNTEKSGKKNSKEKKNDKKKEETPAE